MVIWLKKDQESVAILDGLVRRDELVHVIDLNEAFAKIKKIKKVTQKEADLSAAKIISAAEEHAGLLRAESQKKAEDLFVRAQTEGFQAGLNEWNLKVLQGARKTHEQLRMQRERMAHVVMSAIEKIVPLQDSQGIYKQVLRILSKSMQTLRYVTVRVSPSEVGQAKTALRELASGSDFEKLIEVIADESLGLGACLVESDQGIVDLSLNSQIIAIRTAISETVKDLPDSGDTIGESPHD